MGVNMDDFAEMHDKAIIAFVINDDWNAVKDYCAMFGIDMSDDPDVMAAGIYKAAQEVTTMPDEVKVKAAIKCMKLGFSPFMRPY